MRLISTIGIFITMNPGYAGRSELPDNLKALFRPVTLVVPDLLLICENMLMSEGFTEAKLLAKKMTVLYNNLAFGVCESEPIDLLTIVPWVGSFKVMRSIYKSF